MNMPAPMPIGHTVYFRRIPEIRVEGKPLGRHVRRDSRDLAYLYQQKRPYSLLSDQLWTRKIPILNQLKVGACTGNEQTGVLGTEPFYSILASTLTTMPTLDEAFALKIYSQAETIDGDGPYPPNDNGSSGSSAAQAAKNDGYISGYLHITNVNDMADALQDGPVGVGVDWYTSFDTPNSSGFISITPGATVRGGHEFVVRGVQVASQLFQADNSWGTSYGVNGSFDFGWSTMEQLFESQGDCTQCVPLTSPAPIPSPVPASASQMFWQGGPGMQMPGGLEAWAGQTRYRPDLAELQHDADAWAKAMGLK